MMPKKSSHKITSSGLVRADHKTDPLFTLLMGFVAYLAGGTLVGLLAAFFKFDVSGSFYDSAYPSDDFIILFVGAAIGGILLLLLFKIFTITTLIKTIVLSTLGIGCLFVIYFIEILWLFASGFFIFHLAFLICFVLANAVYGAFIGPIFIGARSIGFSALVCGLTAIPFGLLSWQTSGLVLAGINLAAMVLVASLGATTGLSIGLYRLLKTKEE
ncbi:hypothetical protein [Acetobacterium paludosum]|uniref:hypothetical protein n=1 Tax=Acetobacterium paludosum TaxID=52693 RepID=UPI00147837D6|nr:hypothetical protein [Acetobacterium paludosum]